MNKKVTRNRQKTVFVGLSGGVDSAVSAAVLKKSGYYVVGVFIKTWHPDFLPCNEEEERRDAMRVATYLNIPFLTFDFEDVYKKEVADYMIAEYKAGRTPNPDVMCNQYVKFGSFLKKALSMGADFVATGHYAIHKNVEQVLSCSSHSNLRVVNENNFAYVAESTAPHFLEKGIDPSKDQSYFLWTLKQKQLSKIIFPIGHLKKTEVRKLANKFGLPVAEKKDSQGICFLGAVDLKNFLKHYIKEKKGDVVIIPNEGGGKRRIIGYHSGVVFYTLGERHGFTITEKSPEDSSYYVISKDIKKNILYVSQKKDLKTFALGNKQKQKQKEICGVSDILNFPINIKNANWISGVPKSDKTYQAQIRYHGEFLSCKIKCSKFDFEQKRAEIIFVKPISVASGQSIVIYDHDVCLGGGIAV